MVLSSSRIIKSASLGQYETGLEVPIRLHMNILPCSLFPTCYMLTKDVAASSAAKELHAV
jgi:hypothetical protein